LVTDFFVNSDQKIVYVIDKAGWLYKLQYEIKNNNPLAKLISKFSVKDNQGGGVTNFFTDIYGIKL